MKYLNKYHGSMNWYCYSAYNCCVEQIISISVDWLNSPLNYPEPTVVEWSCQSTRVSVVTFFFSVMK